MFLRLSLWAAYLGADWVAVYILGFLSRQDAPAKDTASSGTDPLAFMWAPFLLIHLGGQDTITAFAIEDNNLWLRHFLNLGVQVALALYVFWKSSGWRNVHLLVPGIFLFAAGIIKYGERTVALKHGTLRSLESSAATTDTKLAVSRGDPSSEGVRVALHAMPGVRDVFSGRTTYQMDSDHNNALTNTKNRLIESQDLSMKVLEIELAMIYDDLYTKAKVLRNMSGIIFRSISQVCMIVALVVFLLSNRGGRHGKADVAITYVLFLGGFCLEICAVFRILVSPWTWWWLEKSNGRFSCLARMSWCLLSRRIGSPEERTLWSNSMGQYDLLSYTGQYGGKPRLWKQGVMKMIRSTVSFVGFGKGALFWFSKMLDTTHVKVDKEMMEWVSQGVQYHSSGSSTEQYFRNLAPALIKIERVFRNDFGSGLVLLHTFTEVHLSKYPAALSDTDDANNPAQQPAKEKDQVLHMVEVCRKLSTYMFYLLTSHPEMLPASGSTEATLESFLKKLTPDGTCSDIDLLDRASEALKAKRNWGIPELQPCKDTLEEIRDIWVWIIIYVAGKSRPDMHASKLATGGEFLSFAWLLMLHYFLGDSGTKRIELSSASGQQGNVAYVFNLDHLKRPRV
jgi:hypothetical protein